MAGKSNKGRAKKKAAEEPKKTARTVAKKAAINSAPNKAKKPAAEPKKVQTVKAKAKGGKKTEHKEPKPPAKVMKELERLAEKHSGQAAVTAPKPPAPKTAEKRIVPTGNGVIKEITVKYKF